MSSNTNIKFTESNLHRSQCGFMCHERPYKVSTQSDHKYSSINVIDQGPTESLVTLLSRGCPGMLLGCPNTNSSKHVFACSQGPIQTGHPVLLIVLNNFKSCSRSRDCKVIINTTL